MRKQFILIFVVTFIACNAPAEEVFSQQTIETKFAIPNGYERQILSEFHQWIISQPLKEDNKVFYSNGQEKINDNIWAAVFDYELGTHKYHQCADAAIYLNAMYKYENGYKDQLVYSFTNGDKSSYKEWLDGAHYNLDPNDVRVLKKIYKSKREDNLITFYSWLKMLWTWAGTGSLPFDTKEVEISDMKPGDIFNQGGHAISIVDVIINKSNGNKKFMIAQSFMIDPAMGDEQHILLNPINGNVWYDISNQTIYTPEWTMNPEIIRFKK